MKDPKVMKDNVRTDSVENRTFRKLIERSNDVILLVNAQFRIKYANEALYSLLGYKADDMIGSSVFDLLDPANASALKDFIKEGRHSSSGSNFTEVVLTCRNGENIHFDVDLMDLLSDDDVNGLVVTLHNISKRKRIEEKLLKANNELDHFVYRTSHDLRAPLLSSLGLIELAKRDDEYDKKEYLNMIEASLNKLDTFIEDINRFYSNEKLTIRKELVDFDFLLQNAITNMRSIHGKPEIDIRYNLSKISGLYSDPNRIKIIIDNILSNSVKYSDGGKPASYINIDIQITPDRCRLRFEDNGIGIRKERLDRIFDIFYRADESAQGSGLGLYIVKDTVDKLGGKVEVQSEYGDGSSFTVTIPNFLAAETSNCI